MFRVSRVFFLLFLIPLHYEFPFPFLCLWIFPLSWKSLHLPFGPRVSYCSWNFFFPTTPQSSVRTFHSWTREKGPMSFTNSGKIYGPWLSPWRPDRPLFRMFRRRRSSSTRSSFLPIRCLSTFNVTVYHCSRSSFWFRGTFPCLNVSLPHPPPPLTIKSIPLVSPGETLRLQTRLWSSYFVHSMY